MGHAYARLHYHLVFSTKQRQPFIKPDLKPRLHAYMAGIVRNLEGVVEEIGGVDDHVHLLFYCPTKEKLSDVIGKIKSNSSGWVHETWPDRAAFAWQGGYGVFSVSESNVESLKTYIQDQENHHKRMTFQEEFLALLQKHNIPYDERYVWD